MVKIKRYKLGHLRENKKIGVCAILDCSNVFTGWDNWSFRKFCFLLYLQQRVQTVSQNLKNDPLTVISWKISEMLVRSTWNDVLEYIEKMLYCCPF